MLKTASDIPVNNDQICLTVFSSVFGYPLLNNSKSRFTIADLNVVADIGCPEFDIIGEFKLFPGSPMLLNSSTSSPAGIFLLFLSPVI